MIFEEDVLNLIGQTTAMIQTQESSPLNLNLILSLAISWVNERTAYMNMKEPSCKNEDKR